MKIELMKYIITPISSTEKKFKDILDIRNYNYLSCLIHLFANEMNLKLTINDIDNISKYMELQKYYI